MVASGPPATRSYELRQAWKGATVVVDLCAGVWLEVPPPPCFKFLVQLCVVTPVLSIVLFLWLNSKWVAVLLICN